MKVGIVGCGVVSQYHVAAWKQNGANQFVYCDSDPNKKAEYTDYKEMMAKENLDGISICTPPFNHAAILREALKNPKTKVLVEKPFTYTAIEAKEFVDSNRICVVHNEVLTSYYYEALQFIHNGYIGKVYEASIYLMDALDDMMTANLNHWSYKMRCGRIAESLPHPIYTAQKLLNQDDLSVGDVTATTFSDRPTFKDLRFSLHSSDATAHINVRMNALKPTSHMVAFGSNGVVSTSLIPQYFFAKQYGEHNDGKKFKLKASAPALTRSALIKSLLSGAPLFGGLHAYHNMRIIDEVLDKLEKQK